MSAFNKIVNVALGEIRNMDGIITPLSNAAIYPGQLFTANRNGVLGPTGVNTMNGYVLDTGCTFTLNTAGNKNGVGILMEQEDIVTVNPCETATVAQNTTGVYGRVHLLKSGEEVTVRLSAAPAAAIAVGDTLDPAANGFVVKSPNSDAVPMFKAIEPVATSATGDGLRILAQVL